MKSINSGMTEENDLNPEEKSVFLVVLEHWPCTPMEVAIQLKEKTKSREEKRRASTKYSYYLKKLVAKKLLLSKKSGNTMIVWPLMTEKYRAIHDIITRQEPEHIALLMHKHKIQESENNA